MPRILAFILAGGRSRRLGVLTRHRAKAAVPFGGRYRIIDFVLSNCVNSRIDAVQIAAQYSPRSLQQHIRLGRPWDLDRRDGGIHLLQPYMGREDSYWYRGTADALYRNLDMISAVRPQLVLVLSGDQIYRMNYGEMIRQHLRNKSLVTLAVKPVEAQESRRFGMVEVDGPRVVRFEEKPEATELRLANLGVYLFDARYLFERLRQTVPEGRYDLVWDLVIPGVEQRQVSAYIYEGYWEDVGEIDAYFKANRSLLPAASSYLLDRKWPIYTRSEERPPAKFGRQAVIDNSIVANGCRVYGTVERSVLFPGVLVGEGSVVRDSILFSGSAVHRDALVHRVILDKRAVVGDGARLGTPEACEALLGRSEDGEIEVRTQEGLTVVGKETRLPAGFERTAPAMIDSYQGEGGVHVEVEIE